MHERAHGCSHPLPHLLEPRLRRHRACRGAERGGGGGPGGRRLSGARAVRRPGPVLRPAPPVQFSRKVGEVKDGMLEGTSSFAPGHCCGHNSTAAGRDPWAGAGGGAGLPRRACEGALATWGWAPGPAGESQWKGQCAPECAAQFRAQGLCCREAPGAGEWPLEPQDESLCRAPTEDIWKGGDRLPLKPRGPGGQTCHQLGQLPRPLLFS